MSAVCYRKIEEYFRAKTGITFQEKLALFFIKVNSIMNRLQIYECSEFYAKLLDDERLFLMLLQELVVSQSYFFREDAHFTIMQELIERNFLIHPYILSIPCASGEEPYSIAIYLLEHGQTNFSIDAVDINPLAIAKAKEGYYHFRELKYIPLHIKSRYFIQVDNGYKIVDSVKSSITFIQANLFDITLESQYYDFIFCRNLFIYLEEKRKQEALAIFHRLLKPKGYLFLSFSDHLQDTLYFDKITINNKIIYQKVDV